MGEYARRKYDEVEVMHPTAKAGGLSLPTRF